MPDHRRRNCTCCGKSSDEVGPISWSGNCLDCAKALLEENVLGISERRGPAYRRFLRGIARFAERELLDDRLAAP
jgi:hypothetical protein